MAARRPFDGDHVWIVNHYAGAPDQPTGGRHFDLARQLVAQGHTVTIFAAGFNHATGREERLAVGRLYRSEWFDHVQFIWLRTVPYRGNTLRRQVNMLSFLVVFLIVQSRFGAPNTIIGSTVHPFAAFGAWLAARLRGGQFVFEIRDLWPQTLVDLGALRVGSPGERLLRWLEAFLVRHASVVITLLPGIRDYLTERGLTAHHVVYIPNGVDLEEFDAAASAGIDAPGSVAQSLAAIARLRGEGRYVLGYVGSFGRVNRLDVIVQAAGIAERRAPGRIGVVLIGDGPERPDLELLVEGDRAVALGSAVPRRHVPTILRALDATLIHATATSVYRYGISFNKLFQCMAAGRPVVFACASAYDPIAAIGAGLSVKPDDPDRLADALLALAATDPDDRTRMGAAGRRYVAREHNIERLGDTLNAVIEGRVPTSREPDRH